MNLEIVTIQDAQGVILEKQELTGLNINQDGAINLNGRRIIKRLDGQDVEANTYINIHIPVANLDGVEGQYTASDLASIQTALTALKNKIKTVLEKSKQTV